MVSLEDRVGRLEKTNRLLLAIAAAAVVLGVSMGALQKPHREGDVQNVLRAKRLEILDGTGRVVLAVGGVRGTGDVEMFGDEDALGRKASLSIGPSSFVMKSRYGEEVIKLMHVDDREGGEVPPFHGIFDLMVHEGTANLRISGSGKPPEMRSAAVLIGAGVGGDAVEAAVQVDAEGVDGSSTSLIRVLRGSAEFEGSHRSPTDPARRTSWSATADQKSAALRLREGQKSRSVLIE